MNRHDLEDEIDILTMFHYIIHCRTLGIIPEVPIIRPFGHLDSNDAIDKIHKIIHKRLDEIQVEIKERFIIKGERV